jgi:hypothetical protein
VWVCHRDLSGNDLTINHYHCDTKGINPWSFPSRASLPTEILPHVDSQYIGLATYLYFTGI